MDRDIKVVVKDRVATAEGDPVIICGNSDYTVAFSFDDEWAGVEMKTARFKYLAEDGVHHIDQPFIGDAVDVPVLINIREVEVGVYAGALTTTTGASIRCEPCIRCGSGDEVEPDPDKYDALMKLINEGGLGITAEQAANLASNTAARHEHDNKPVLDGITDEDLENLAANTAARHAHSNASILDKLGDSDGGLTYDGKPIGGSGERLTHSVELNEGGYVDFYVYPSSANQVLEIVAVGLDVIPNNAEIKTIEINLNKPEYPGYIDFQNLENEVKADEPGFAKFKKAVHDEDTQEIKLATLYFPFGGVVADTLLNDGGSLRVTYYE